MTTRQIQCKMRCDQFGMVFRGPTINSLRFVCLLISVGSYFAVVVSFCCDRSKQNDIFGL